MNTSQAEIEGWQVFNTDEHGKLIDNTRRRSRGAPTREYIYLQRVEDGLSFRRGDSVITVDKPSNTLYVYLVHDIKFDSLTGNIEIIALNYLRWFELKSKTYYKQFRPEILDNEHDNHYYDEMLEKELDKNELFLTAEVSKIYLKDFVGLANVKNINDYQMIENKDPLVDFFVRYICEPDSLNFVSIDIYQEIHIIRTTEVKYSEHRLRKLTVLEKKEAFSKSNARSASAAEAGSIRKKQKSTKLRLKETEKGILSRSDTATRKGTYKSIPLSDLQEKKATDKVKNEPHVTDLSQKTAMKDTSRNIKSGSLQKDPESYRTSIKTEMSSEMSDNNGTSDEEYASANDGTNETYSANETSKCSIHTTTGSAQESGKIEIAKQNKDYIFPPNDKCKAIAPVDRSNSRTEVQPEIQNQGKTIESDIEEKKREHTPQPPTVKELDTIQSSDGSSKTNQKQLFVDSDDESQVNITNKVNAIESESFLDEQGGNTNGEELQTGVNNLEEMTKAKEQAIDRFKSHLNVTIEKYKGILNDFRRLHTEKNNPNTLKYGPYDSTFGESGITDPLKSSRNTDAADMNSISTILKAYIDPAQRQASFQEKIPHLGTDNKIIEVYSSLYKNILAQKSNTMICIEGGSELLDNLVAYITADLSRSNKKGGSIKFNFCHLRARNSPFAEIWKAISQVVLNREASLAALDYYFKKLAVTDKLPTIILLDRGFENQKDSNEILNKITEWLTNEASNLYVIFLAHDGKMPQDTQVKNYTIRTINLGE